MWKYFTIRMIIRYFAIRTLSRYFTYVVSMDSQHELIEQGLYRNIRHPAYLGELLIFLALAWYLQSGFRWSVYACFPLLLSAYG
jgi:protein-S-isoprenylcysteine O-methyltransferase Ste14